MVTKTRFWQRVHDPAYVPPHPLKYWPAGQEAEQAAHDAQALPAGAELDTLGPLDDAGCWVWATEELRTVLVVPAQVFVDAADCPPALAPPPLLPADCEHKAQTL